MNPSTLIGILASVILLGVVLFFSTEDPARFIDLPGLGIVLVGTLAATFISYPLKEVMRIFGLIGTVMRNERMYAQHDIEELVAISRIWMTGDITKVEQALDQVSNPFLKTGVQLIIDMTPEQDIIDLLQWRISKLRAKEHAEAQLFRTMAGYAPAFGMLGTLVGLVNLMFMLGDGDLTAIGQQMSLALMTTLYGILLANLLFKPIAVKLERRTEERVALMNMIMQGLSMMSQKRGPAFMRETMKTFMADYEDELNDRNNGTALQTDNPPAQTAVDSEARS
ncbi:MAG TPA: MotA/TolQ/ExbB proton channel family protein [Pusillimonas sp.]|uniref:motility protein A n=1 Tax=Pusillimonas sp. TaxID=3040095 RepID=UPI002BF711EC|nr:MotA/TolQ/ExbB proton channel family protein [Pusillimonas sp.]HUH88033.1 MotA/TolQ/ExbB proton channel family protein [Pusillimonas sp.]